LVEASRYLVVIAVISLLVAATVAFAFGALDTARALGLLVHGAREQSSTVALIKIMDTFLVAAALLLFGIGLYGVFIERLELPAWRAISDLDALKDRLASVVILALASTFLEHVVAWEDALRTLYEGLAVALVIVALVQFRKSG
jgi:uncharacterized membrane protein YqhA